MFLNPISKDVICVVIIIVIIIIGNIKVFLLPHKKLKVNKYIKNSQLSLAILLYIHIYIHIYIYIYINNNISTILHFFHFSV